MQKKSGESWFSRLYLWSAKTKFTMGILFAYCVFAYLVCGMLSGTEGVAVGFFMALQMVLACFFIGIAQQLLIPNSDFTKPRCALWVVTGTIILAVSALVFRWFAQMPGWCLVMFTFCNVFVMIAMVYSLHLELRHETKILNRQLERFQKNAVDGMVKSDVCNTH